MMPAYGQCRRSYDGILQTTWGRSDMKTVLVIFFLSVQSSYSGNTEVAATPISFDTVQFYASNGSAWRIKTYARDEDVHIWSIGSNVDDIINLAKENTAKHYGDVLAEGYVIETSDGLEGVKRELFSRGLDDHLERLPSGAVFWSPLGTRYRSKSVPE
jgi:hypothetical protein